ncbi:hypothetical protein [Litchfieldella xinjiangensis]|uniref:hypothetical protein n=1 Tax=Litchfieldella xinjiangensis TaxID=1166948 RepID=UPI0005B832A9|nr:hypothetical protein [Halomonas xinjiangensis]
MQRIAVLTGDLVDSRKASDPKRLFEVLDTALDAVADRFGGRGERYRGDGFQLALPQAGHAMQAAILLRAALIRHSEADQRWDARIAVAVGDDDWQHDAPIAEATGKPFVHSGRQLDALDSRQAQLAIELVDEADDRGLNLLTRFADELVAGWSHYSAEVVYCTLWHAESQHALAERLGISQPSVHKRLRSARWPLLSDYLDYVQHRIEAPHE